MKKYFLYTLIALSVAIQAQARPSFGHSSLFNRDWRFSLADSPDMSQAGFDDSAWRTLDLPHDWSVDSAPSREKFSCTGWYPGGVAWYRKHFTLTDGRPHHYIYFEGVYNRSEVYLNGHLLGTRPNGYVSFAYDLTPYLRDGENVIAVRVDHSREADSRWYTGSGIYRDVYLVSAQDVHFGLWGIGWSAESISDDGATVRVDVTPVSEPGHIAGELRAEAVIRSSDGRIVGRSSSACTPGERTYFNVDMSEARRWDLDSPYLYTLETALYENGAKVDEADCRIGLRTLDFDPDKGFFLNGKNLKVKGVCLHHDAGVLGAAVPAEVWRRRLAALKSIGTNAIRCSHNPQAPVLYDLCDELGLLVMDEGSDEWEFPKRKWLAGWNVGEPGFEGSYDFFEEWIDRDITDMVMRDRNHPSIFLWSVGNEVDYPNDPYSHPILDGSNAVINQPMFGGYKSDAPHAERIGKIAKRIAARIRAVDTSRPVTGALAGVIMSNQTEYPEAVDVVGYNYTENRYAEDHAAYPGRIIYGSENGHGYGEWKAVRDNDFIFGQFIWTGTDYLGESGAWPSRGLHTGLLDFGSFVRSRGKFRAALWSDAPATHIVTMKRPRNRKSLPIDAEGAWNYALNEPVRVLCYTNAAKVRLSLDGRQIGDVKEFDDNTGIIYWDLPFTPGRLIAQGLDEDGRVVSADMIETAGQPHSIKVSTDCGSVSGAQGVAFLTVEVVDSQGRRVPNAADLISCSIEGPARLLGLENSDNTDMTHPKASSRRVYRGRLLAYIVPEGSGKVKVRFSADRLPAAETVIEF